MTQYSLLGISEGPAAHSQGQERNPTWLWSFGGAFSFLPFHCKLTNTCKTSMRSPEHPRPRVPSRPGGHFLLCVRVPQPLPVKGVLDHLRAGCRRCACFLLNTSVCLLGNRTRSSVRTGWSSRLENVDTDPTPLPNLCRPCSTPTPDAQDSLPSHMRSPGTMSLCSPLVGTVL